MIYAYQYIIVFCSYLIFSGSISFIPPFINLFSQSFAYWYIYFYVLKVHLRNLPFWCFFSAGRENLKSGFRTSWNFSLFFEIHLPPLKSFFFSRVECLLCSRQTLVASRLKSLSRVRKLSRNTIGRWLGKTEEEMWSVEFAGWNWRARTFWATRVCTCVVVKRARGLESDRPLTFSARAREDFSLSDLSLSLFSSAALSLPRWLEKHRWAFRSLFGPCVFC